MHMPCVQRVPQVMGFTVGWAFYDVLSACFSIDRNARQLTSTPLTDLSLALTSTFCWLSTAPC